MDDVWKVTWNDVEFFVRTVANLYRDAKITGVYGIPRGGIILASLLSYRLDVPMLLAPCRNCIVIDDISDTGETLLHFDRNSSDNGKNKGYHIVTMFYKKESLVKPEFYMYEKTDAWIVYPWEDK